MPEINHEDKHIKYYKFDMNMDNVCEEYGGSYTDAFQDMRDGFLENNCHFIQESGIVTNEPVTDAHAIGCLSDVFSGKHWLAKCIAKLEVTDLVEYHDLTGLAIDFCDGKEPVSVDNTEKKKFCVTYDFSTDKLKESFSNVGTAYVLMLKEFETEGFSKTQRSMLLSNNEITYDEALVKISNVCKRQTWIAECLTHFDLSVQGNVFDMSDKIHKYANNNLYSHEVMKARDELFLGMYADDKKDAFYFKDKEFGVCYKYEMKRKNYLMSKIYNKFNELANEIAVGDYSSFKVVNNREYNKAIQEANVVFNRLMEEDKAFCFAQNRKNFNQALYYLRNEPYKKHEDLDIGVGFTDLKYGVINKGDNVFSSLAYYGNERIKNLVTDESFIVTNLSYKTLNNQLYLPEGSEKIDVSSLWSSLYEYETDKRSTMLRKTESMYLPSEMSLEDMKEAVGKFVKENFTDLGYPAQAFISQSRHNSNKYVATVFSSMRKMENNEWVKKKQDNMYIDKDGNRINPVPSPVITANGKVFREKDGSIRMQMGYLPFRYDKDGNPMFLDKEKTIPDRIELRVPMLDKDGNQKVVVKGANKIGKRGKLMKPRIVPVFRTATHIDGYVWKDYIPHLRDSWTKILNAVCEKNNIIDKNGKPLKIIFKNNYTNFLEYAREHTKDLDMSQFVDKARVFIKEYNRAKKKEYAIGNSRA